MANNMNFVANFLRSFANLHLFQILIIISGLFNLTVCLYEDQVGKFDWRQRYIGKVKFAAFDTISTTQKILVATEENVLAALNIRTGQLLWRRILEKGQSGQIRAFSFGHDGSLITVSGGVPALVRCWNLASGHILTEWPVVEQNPERFEDVEWYIKDGTLHHVLPIYNSRLEITSYDSRTGEKLKTKKVSAPFISQEAECLLAGPYYICLKGDSNLAMVFFINIFDPNPETRSLTVNNIFGAGSQGPYHVNLIPGNENAIIISAENNKRKRLLYLEKILVPKFVDLDTKSSLFSTHFGQKKVILETFYKNEKTEIAASEYTYNENENIVKAEEPQSLLSITHNSLYKPLILASDCSSKLLREKMCKFLVLSEDYSLSLVRQNKVAWTREESLSKILTTEFVELPMSDEEQAIETEFDQKERDIFSMLIRRLASQANQLKTFLQKPLGFTPSPNNQRADLVRDKFGLDKMIIAVTTTGKIFGIESKKGEIIWQSRVPGIKPFNNSNSMVLYIQRGSRHYPQPPQCSLLATDKDTDNGVIYTFNPITGAPLGVLTKLNYKIKQTMLLHTMTETFLRSIVIIDNNDEIHVFPENSDSVVASASKNTYLFTVDRKTGILTGLSFSYSSPQKLVAHKVWELVFSPKTQVITHVASKNPIERVHSQGRVLGDRSVLYKYVNPNLVAIVTQGVSGSQKNTLNLYLLDVVSGSIVFSVVHKRVKGPVHIVHSENWLVYSYFNEKSRRTEVATIELYEGKTQSNTTTFSSLSSTKLPIVERQAYIFPASIEFMQETITEKGITSKHILVALSNGGVLELPWILLDPRRPINPDMREEGVIPYMPELPIQMDAIVNYNQSVHRVTGIHTSPSGLESTCLVFVYGLDLFYTRIAPSKTFDVLKEDFDYFLIVTVLAGLVIASYITKRLASQKIQKQAWK